MADTFKVLAQSTPSATTLTDIYTVPSSTSTITSTIVVCNRGGGDTTYRIAVAVAGAADATKQYLAYDAAILANESLALRYKLTLAATDVVRVYAGNANLSFNLYGMEVT